MSGGSQVDTQLWCPPVPAYWVGGEFNKTTKVPATTSILERAAAPSLALKPDSGVPTCMSMVLFELLSLPWSLG